MSMVSLFFSLKLYPIAAILILISLPIIGQVEVVVEIPSPDSLHTKDAAEALSSFGPPDDGGDGFSGAFEVKDYGYNIFENINDTPELASLTTRLFGDKISMFTGDIRFEQVDISLPGNSAIPVAITRTLSNPDAWFKESLEFENWSLAIPHVRSTYITDRSGNYKTAYWPKGKACTSPLNANPSFSTSTGGTSYYIHSNGYWNGDSIYIPGKGTVKLTTKSGDSSHKRYNNLNWKVDCVTNTGTGHEGFKVITKDGLTYYFTQKKIVRSIKDLNLQPQVHQCRSNCPLPTLAPLGDAPRLSRYPQYHYFMLATKIQDRFGNWVKYAYDSKGLVTRIYANDGRNITISSRNGRIESITANGRQWRYRYDDYRLSTLKEVERPDGKLWRFAHDKSSSNTFWWHVNIAKHSQIPTRGIDCIEGGARDFVDITHPEGARGSFVVDEVCHGQSNIPKLRKVDPSRSGVDSFWFPKAYATFALRDKSIILTSGEQYKWNYTYSSNEGLFRGETIRARHRLSFGVSGVETAHLSSTTLEHHDGSKEIHYFDRKHGSSQGNLRYVETYSSSGSLLQRKSMTYANGAFHGTAKMYLNVTGSQDPFSANDIKNGYSAEQIQRLTKSIITQISSFNDSDNYVTQFSSFDSYDLPSLKYEYNSTGSQKRYTKTNYFHDTRHWLLGLHAKTAISANGSNYKTTSQTSYHSSSGSYKSLPNYYYSYGRWHTRNTSYHTSGVNAGLPNQIHYNGTNRWVALSNYKRGVAQTIRTPSSLSTSSQYAYKQVDANGWVTKHTDFIGNCVNYRYDSIGRLTLIDPCNSKWLSTSISYNTTANSEGYTHVRRGMLKRTIKRGNYSYLTFYDNLLRPRMTKESDTSRESETKRFTRTNYDSFNRPIYQSKPYSLNATPYGVSIRYDALGRALKEEDNTTAGAITYSYLSSNRVQVTNNRGYKTTSKLLAYGTPELKRLLTISSPHGVSTTLAYNVYGNVTSIRQGGVTESRVYDSYQQLCKTIRPDIGNVAFFKNALGKTEWSSRGSSINSSTNSCDYSVSSSDKTTVSYDNLGKVKRVSYGDGTPSKVYEYDKNKRLTRLSFGNATQNYTYDDLGNLLIERLRVDNIDWSFNYLYNSTGNLHRTTYPSGRKVDYHPNALGQPRYVGAFANSVLFHPDGQYKSYKQSNGCVNSKSLRSSGLPYTQRTQCGGTNVLYNQYSYDANGNLTFWDDKQSSVYDLRFGYDQLDRLDNIRKSNSALIGDMNYDSMGNITKFDSIVGTIHYSYNSKKQLQSTSGSRNYDFNYDHRGAVTDNGFHRFHYNLASQMTEAGGNQYVYDGHNKRVKANDSNGVRYSMYSMLNGKLVQENINGANREYYYLNSQLVAQTGAGSLIYIHGDLLGTSAAKTNSAGSVTKRIRYAPFGLQWGHSNAETGENEIGYTGHKHDTDIGLTYMQARYYDPVIGRFYSNDPVDVLGAIERGNPVHGFNRYAYVNNNPYKYTDPDGEFGIVGFAIGFGTELASQYIGGDEINLTKATVMGVAGALTGGLASLAKSSLTVGGKVIATAGEKVAASGLVVTGGAVSNAGASATNDSMAGLSTGQIVDNAVEAGVEGLAPHVKSMGKIAGNIGNAIAKKTGLGNGASEMVSQATSAATEKVISEACNSVSNEC